jgi:hypothetical protein
LDRVAPAASTHTYSARMVSSGYGRALYLAITVGSSWDRPVVLSNNPARSSVVVVVDDDEAMGKAGDAVLWRHVVPVVVVVVAVDGAKAATDVDTTAAKALLVRATSATRSDENFIVVAGCGWVVPRLCVGNNRIIK